MNLMFAILFNFIMKIIWSTTFCCYFSVIIDISYCKSYQQNGMFKFYNTIIYAMVI